MRKPRLQDAIRSAACQVHPLLAAKLAEHKYCACCRSLTEANLAASPPQVLSADNAQELLTVLTRKCGDAPALSPPAQELVYVLFDTIFWGKAPQARCAA